jgi:hypothetical protein
LKLSQQKRLVYQASRLISCVLLRVNWGSFQLLTPVLLVRDPFARWKEMARTCLVVRLFSLFAVSFASTVIAASCSNYGVSLNNGTCSCPPGFGGPTCSLVACGGNVFQGAQRSDAATSSTTPFSNVTACDCESGWTGVGCNGSFSRAKVRSPLKYTVSHTVCTGASACQSGFTSAFGNSSSIGNPYDGQNDTIICNTTPRVYAAGELSCQINNPTLQGLFPGTSVLNVLRTLNQSLALAPNLTSFGGSGVAYVQAFYEGVEQFFCQASSCTSVSDSTSSNWTCPTLRCTCRTNTTFCGGIPVQPDIVHPLLTHF